MGARKKQQRKTGQAPPVVAWVDPSRKTGTAAGAKAKDDRAFLRSEFRYERESLEAWRALKAK